MARGRKSQGAGDVFSIRIPRDLRERLQASADQNGQSLNNEIRRRLEWSLEDEQRISERFGDLRTFAFFRLLHLAVETLGMYGTPRRKFWLDDRYQYLQVASAIEAIFEAMEPSGPRAPKGEADPEGTGLVIAECIIRSIEAAGKPIPEEYPEELKDALVSTFRPEVESGIHASLAQYLKRVGSDFFFQKFRLQITGRAKEGNQ